MPTACVDTNVWFYALARPVAGETAKHDAARTLIASLERPVITPQIVNELAFNLLRKRAWSEAEMRGLLGELLGRCRLFIPSAEWHAAASLLRERYKLAYWDSLLLASARAAGCEILHSEDMQHGMRIDDALLISSPFVAA